MTHTKYKQNVSFLLNTFYDNIEIFSFNFLSPYVNISEVVKQIFININIDRDRHVLSRGF